MERLRIVALSDGTVDLEREVVTRGGAVTPLTTREAALFAYLASRPGEVLTRDELQTEVWGYAASVVSRTVDTTIRRLRTKIEADPSRPVHLQTVHGQGYRFQPLQPAGVELVGRAAELGAIDAALGDHPRVGLVGAAGVGKSRLLQAVAERLRSAGRPVAWIDAAGAADPRALALRIALAAGISVGDDPVRQVGAAMPVRGALWVLDGVEPGALPAVGRWRARILLASRERRPLPGTAWVELAPLPPADAVALFVARAREADPSFAAPPELVEEVVDRLDRLPLAIELAAARCHVLSPSALLERLAEPMAVLGDGNALQRAFLAAWDGLDARERRILAACAAFDGPFPLEAAEAVVDGVPPGAVLEGLTTLRDRSLVLTHRDAGELRFRLLHAVRSLAGRHQDDRAALLRRRAAWLARAGAAAAAALDGPGAAEAVVRIRALRRDLASAADLDPGDAGLVRALDAALELDGPAPERVHRLRVALGAGVPAAARPDLLRRLSCALRVVGRHDEARLAANEALVEAVGEGRAEALVAAAFVERPGVAGARAREALALRPRPATAVLAWMALARDERRAGARAGCEQALRRALEVVRAAPVPRLEGAVLSNLANARREAGRSAEAETLYRRAHESAVALGQARVAASALLNLGGLLAERDDLSGAVVTVRQALHAAREAGEALLVAHVLHTLGYLLHARDRLDEAEAAYIEAIGLLRELDPALAASALGDLGALLADLDQVDEAEHTLAEAGAGVAEQDRAVLGVHRAHLDLALARRAVGPRRDRLVLQAAARIRHAEAAAPGRARMAIRLARWRMQRFASRGSAAAPAASSSAGAST